jgi:hypothetical protein
MEQGVEADRFGPVAPEAPAGGVATADVPAQIVFAFATP